MARSECMLTDRHFKMNISQSRGLELRKEYIIITFDTNEVFRGTFDDWDDMDDIIEDMYTTYYHMPNRDDSYFCCNYYFTCNNKKYMFNQCDYYYNVKEFKCEIKRLAEKARQQMEQRSLNMILNRLINEHFQWS
jgi:two-component SAPR family response regulator